MVLNAPHPVCFYRLRRFKLDHARRVIATQERIIDYALVLVHGEPHIPTFLSTVNFYQNRHNGIIIPKAAFDDLDLAGGHDALSPFLGPTIFQAKSLQTFIKQHGLIPKLGDVDTIRKANHASLSRAHIFWTSPHLQSRYGPYTTTYILTARRQRDRSSRSNHLSGVKRGKIKPGPKREDRMADPTGKLELEFQLYQAEHRKKNDDKNKRAASDPEHKQAKRIRTNATQKKCRKKNRDKINAAQNERKRKIRPGTWTPYSK